MSAAENTSLLWEKDSLCKVRGKIYRIHIERYTTGKTASYKASVWRGGDIVETMETINPDLEFEDVIHNIETRIHINADDLYF